MNQNNQTHNQTEVLERIADALEKLASACQTIAEVELSRMQNELRDAPREKLSFPLSALRTINWREYGYEPLSMDRSGIPEAIRCMRTGRVFRRHNGNENYGVGLIYSRSIGKDERGRVTYEVAVVFSDKVQGPKPVPNQVLSKLPPALTPPADETPEQRQALNQARELLEESGDNDISETQMFIQRCRNLVSERDTKGLLEVLRQWVKYEGEDMSRLSGMKLSDVYTYMMNKYSHHGR